MKTLKKLLVATVLILFSSCVQDTHLKTIHFKLDMSNVENASEVGIRGSHLPLSWNETTFMKDEDNDGIYEVSITLQSASYNIEFKFVNRNKEFELKDKKNRSIRFEYKPETILYEAVFNLPNAETSILK